MLGRCRWLALEVKYLDPVVEFYRDHLGVGVERESDREVALDVGADAELQLRRPDGVPRGGLHTHYAFACPAAAYDAWWDRLSPDFDLEEVDFGGMRSLYFYDPEGNCVEIAGAADHPDDSPDDDSEDGPVDGPDDDSEDGPVDDPRDGIDEETAGAPPLSGVFEVVFEVEDLPAAESFFVDLGFEVVNRGDARKRTRLTTGPFDVELWEPHLGLAEARGGVHVDVGIEADDPEAAADAVADRATKREAIEGGVRIRDPDGHYLSFLE